MNDFDSVINSTIKREGGDKFTNDPLDSGGATKYGISLRFYRSDIDPYANSDTIKALTEEGAISIYKEHFWLKYNLDKIPLSYAASKIFDIGVNIGTRTACKIAQRALQVVYGYGCCEDDGVFGVKTLDLMNKMVGLLSQQRYEAALTEGFACYYRAIKDGPSKSRFINGWLKRVYS